MAATMGFDSLTELAHKVENILDKVRNDELKIETELIDLLFSGLDHIENLLAQIKETGEEQKGVEDYLSQFEAYIAGNNGSKVTIEDENEDKLVEKAVEKYDKNKYEVWENKKIIVTNIRDILIGVLVDNLREVVTLNVDNIEEMTDSRRGLKEDFIEGVVNYNGDLLVIINIEKILFADRENEEINDG